MRDNLNNIGSSTALTDDSSFEKTRILADCPVCDDTDSQHLTDLRDHYRGDIFSLHSCTKCGAQFLKDPPSQHLIGNYYRNAVGEVMWKRSNSVFSRLNRLAMGRDFNVLRSLVPLGSRVLDLGAGSGAPADYLMTVGYKVDARDMFESSQWGHKEITYKQANLNGGFLTEQDVLCNGEAPKVVVMRHVFEHLYSPRKVLDLLYSVGTEYVLIVVPNIESPFASFFGKNWYYWDPPRHLTFFNQESLRNITAKAGYDTVYEKTYGIDEIVTSLYRIELLHSMSRYPERSSADLAVRLLPRMLEPKGVLAALSSAASFWGSTVCWWIGRRRIG